MILWLRLGAQMKSKWAADSLAGNMNDDWKSMFGSSVAEKSIRAAGKGVASGTDAALHYSTDSQYEHLSSTLSTDTPLPGGERGSQTRSGAGEQADSVQLVEAPCKAKLRQLVLHKKQRHDDRYMPVERGDNRPLPAGWKPKGILVAHLHEHRAAVNRIRVGNIDVMIQLYMHHCTEHSTVMCTPILRQYHIDFPPIHGICLAQVNADHSYFATCSNDGSVKVYDCSRLEGNKSVTTRSRLTYSKQEGHIKSLAFCQDSKSIASIAEKGGESASIHVFRIETVPQGPKYSVLHTKKLDAAGEGLPVDLTYYDTGSQNVLTYATTHGLLVGWDLRSPARHVWTLHNDPNDGLITSFDVHAGTSWMCVGTSNGNLVLWDLRFGIALTKITHSTGRCVRRVLAHPHHESAVLGATNGNNEVSMWDMETASRQRVLWASPVPVLSREKFSQHHSRGLYAGQTANNSFILTAGTDMRVRYWDLTQPANSQIIVAGAMDPLHYPVVVSHQSRLIEGTDVIAEVYGTLRQQHEEPAAGVDQAPKRGHDTPHPGHHDTITDINVCKPNQCFMITSSRDGVVKVWK